MMGKGRGRESLEEVRDFHTKVSSRSNIRTENRYSLGETIVPGVLRRGDGGERNN